MNIEGRARRFGDDVNTDYIISSRRKRETIDESQLARWVMEGIDPAFAGSIGSEDIIVGGRNFGCGSAMEVAATVIRAAGIRAVVARSFSRSFYRNAINNGLLVVACDTSGVGEGDRLRIAPDGRAVRVENATLDAAPLPAIMREILSAGGLVGYLRANGRFVIGDSSATLV